MRTLPLLQMIALVAPLALLGACSTGGKHASPDVYRSQAEDAARNTEAARRLNVEAAELIRAGKHADAEPLLRKALAADVMFGPAHNNLGLLHYQRGELYAAAWEFQYAARLLPHQPEPRNNLGLVLEKAGRLDEAAGAYRDALVIEPDNPVFIGHLARAKATRGESDEDLRRLLSDLIYKDNRPEWVSWARERLVKLGDPTSERQTPAGSGENP